MFEEPVLKEKCFFILGNEPSRTSLRRANAFGQALSIDTEKFASIFQTIKTDYVPPEQRPPISYCVQEYSIPEKGERLSDEAIFDLIQFGELNEELLTSSLLDNTNYVVKRNLIDKAIGLIQREHKAIVIHSNLGNGKSLFASQMRLDLKRSGFRVFSLEKRSVDLMIEIDFLCSLKEKSVLFIEDYSDWFNVIEYINLNSSRSLSLVLTARTSPHDIILPRLLTSLSSDSIPEISVNFLTSAEIDQFVVYLNSYGLWGPRSSWSFSRKSGHIRERCDSQISNILLDLFASEQILTRFAALVKSIEEQSSYLRILIGILILNVVSFRISINSLVDIFGTELLSSDFRNSRPMSQLIDFSRGRITLRSSVASEFLLQRFMNPNSIIDVLITIAGKADSNAGVLHDYRYLLQLVTKFSNLQHLLPERDRGKAIIKFYESVKSLYGTKAHPQFWLQYAIACTVLAEFERAGIYFKTAYSLAEKRETNTDQIDNHYARWLLLNAINSNDDSICMREFREARSIINRQVNKERVHYPFRVAAAYGDFYDAFSDRLGKKSKEEIGRAAQFVLNKIASLPEHQRSNRYVVECSNRMEHVISQVQKDATAEDGLPKT